MVRRLVQCGLPPDRSAFGPRGSAAGKRARPARRLVLVSPLVLQPLPRRGALPEHAGQLHFEHGFSLHRDLKRRSTTAPATGSSARRRDHPPSRCSTAARSSRSSLSVASIRARENASISRPCTISYLPFLQVTGQP